MDHTPNLTPIYHYSENFSQAVCQSFFRQKAEIKGQEVLNLTEVRQIDLMVVQSLFDEWQKESRSLQSPYFDYKAPAVQEAFQKLMKLLSQNISIKKEAFAPLLQSATTNALLLLLYPSAYFERLFATLPAKVIYSRHLAPHFKYMKTHPQLIKLIAQRLSVEKEEVSTEAALSAIHQILKQNQGLLEKPHEMLKACSDIIPVGLYELAPDYEEAAAEADELPDEVPENFFKQFDPSGESEEAESRHFEGQRLSGQQESGVSESMTEQIRKDDFAQTGDEEENDANEAIDSYRQDESLAYEEPVRTSIQEQPTPEPKAPAEPEKTEANTAKEQQEPAQPSANHPVRPTAKPANTSPQTSPNRPPASLASRLAQQMGKPNSEDAEEERKKKLARLRGQSEEPQGLNGSIKTSDKLAFIKNLFGGNKADFDKAIEMIDYSPDYHTALDNIKRMYMSKYNWDINGEVTARFIAMIDDAKD